MSEEVFKWESYGLKPWHMSAVLRLLKRDLLIDFHSNGKEPELDAKVEAAYLELEGAPMLRGSRRLQPMELYSPPGHGKTSSYKDAAGWVAKKLGMKFVENPAEGYEPSKNDLLFITHQSYGETSTINYAGLPDKGSTVGSDGKAVPTMTRLLNHRFVMLSMAGRGVLLFDDFANSHPSVHAISLSIATERKYQQLDLTGAYMGFASNLGQQIDGTNAEQPSTAHVSRLRRIPCVDSLQDWVKRERAFFPDAVGDAMVADFLLANPSRFWKLEPVSSDGMARSFPCPRTWSHLVSDARHVIHLIEHAPHKRRPALLSELNQIAVAHVGAEAGDAYASFVRQHLNDITPLAREVITHGERTDPGVIDKIVAATAADTPAPNFDAQMRYIRGCVATTITMLSGSPDDGAVRSSAFRNFHYAILGSAAVSGTKVGDAYSELARSLASSFETMRADLTSGVHRISIDAVKAIQASLAEVAKSYGVDDHLVATAILPALTGSMSMDLSQSSAPEERKSRASKAIGQRSPSP